MCVKKVMCKGCGTKMSCVLAEDAPQPHMNLLDSKHLLQHPKDTPRSDAPARRGGQRGRRRMDGASGQGTVGGAVLLPPVETVELSLLEFWNPGLLRDAERQYEITFEEGDAVRTTEMLDVKAVDVEDRRPRAKGEKKQNDVVQAKIIPGGQVLHFRLFFQIAGTTLLSPGH